MRRGTRPIKEYLVVHHSAGPRSQTAEDIKAFILQRKDLAGRKAYAKLIEQDGSVYDFAGETDTDVAHATGFNTKGIGVCVIGFFDAGRDLVDLDHPQFKALVQTLVVLCRRHNIPPVKIIGHCDTFKLRGVRVQKSCPGSLFHPLIPEIRSRVAAYL